MKEMTRTRAKSKLIIKIMKKLQNLILLTQVL